MHARSRGTEVLRPMPLSASVPCEFELDNFRGRAVLLHRPVWSYDNSDCEDYPYKKHFHGRKRLWEWRIQGQFKQRPSMLYCGIELEEYVPVNFATRTLMRGILPLIQGALQCKLVHHEVGQPDDPDLRPLVVVPIWAADNTLVHTIPAEAPDIAATALPTGLSRKAARQFWENLWNGGGPTWEEGSNGPMFTIALWGPSPLLDLRQWVFRKVPLMWGRDLSMEPFCGPQPVHAVVYELEGGTHQSEHRQDDKLYALDIRMMPAAMWASKAVGSDAPARPLALSAENLEALVDQGLSPLRERHDDSGESFCSAVSQTDSGDLDHEEHREHLLRPPAGGGGSSRAPASERERCSPFDQSPSAQLPTPLVRPAETQGSLFGCCRRRRRPPLAQGFELV